MERTPLDRARSALHRHVLATVLVVLLILGAMLLAEWALTRREANRLAESVSIGLAESVSQILTETDFGAEGFDRAELDARLQGFFDVGAVIRVKVWRVDGERVRVVYSDEPDVEGAERSFDAELAARLDSGEAVVLPVPDDFEHRFEHSQDEELREVYLGFVDGAGNEMRLEVYVPARSDAMTARALGVQVPVIAVGVVLLIGVLTPLSLSLARQLRRLGDERQWALAFAFRARQEERVELARRLHDGVLQSLSGSRLALSAARGSSGADDAVIRRIIDVLAADARTLRGYLEELTAGEPTARTLHDALGELATDGEATPQVTVKATPIDGLSDEAAALIARAAGEGVRNALKHAAARRICIELDRTSDGIVLIVTDDGRGAAAEAREATDADADEHHFGLSMLDSAARSLGGWVEFTSTNEGSLLRLRLPGRDGVQQSAPPSAS